MANNKMFFVDVCKFYDNTDYEEVRFGRTTRKEAEALYEREVRLAERVVDHIKSSGINVSLLHGKRSILKTKTIHPTYDTKSLSRPDDIGARA